MGLTLKQDQMVASVLGANLYLARGLRLFRISFPSWSQTMKKLVLSVLAVSVAVFAAEAVKAPAAKAEAPKAAAVDTAKKAVVDTAKKVEAKKDTAKAAKK